MVDKAGEFLVVQMADYGENEWRFAGGGVEEGETAEEALLRELGEELGTKKFKVVKVSRRVVQFDWPMAVIERRLMKKGKTYKGQRQRQFLVRFEGERGEIRIDPGEIKQVKWAKYDELKGHFVFPGQWEEAEKTLEELVPELVK